MADPDGRKDTPKSSAEGASGRSRAARGGTRGGSLYDPVTATDGENPYGEPGAPVTRSSAFYRGFWGGVGVLFALALGLIVRDVSGVLILILVSAFLAVGLNPLVEFLIRRGLKRGWAVLIVAIAFLIVITTVVVVVVGVLRDQIATLVNDAPHLLDDLRKHKMIRQLDRKYHILSNIQARLKDPKLPEKTFGGVFNAGLGVLGALANTVIIFVLTLYFLGALPQLKRAMYSLVPQSRRRRVAHLGDEILHRVGGYVVGAFLVALLAGTVTLIFLFIVGLGQYAVPLALLVALLDLVPLVGSISGAAVVTIVALATSLHAGIACLIFYLIYEPLEGYVIYPRVMRLSVDVPEYVTILAVLLGGSLGGVVGALLALPIGAAVLLLVREVWVRKQDVS